MRVVNLDHPDVLNNFIVQQGESNFLQSWEWGEFQKAQGKSIYRLGIEDKGNLVAFALVIRQTFPLGKNYLYCPRGPVIGNQESGIRNQEFWEIFSAKVKEIGEKERAIFFRFDFPYPSLPPNLDPAIIKAPADIQPVHTLILDLQKSEEEMLKSMKPKTRYNIRLAQRKGVKIRQSIAKEDLKKFGELLKITASRDNFKPHPKTYYQKMFEILGKRGLLKIFLAEYKEEVLAANLVLFFGQKATYLHGAFSGLYRNVMAPHLLQWEQILEAKRRGCNEYDFWGIAPKVQNSKFKIQNSPKESKLPTGQAKFPKAIPRYRSGCYGAGKVQSWEGITRFKKGFGGKEVSYAGTYDFVLNNFWYKVYCLLRRCLKS